MLPSWQQVDLGVALGELGAVLVRLEDVIERLGEYLEEDRMDKPRIIFKSEDSLWQMMADVGLNGRSAKPFNMRRWEMADDRIYRLAWGTHLDEAKQLEPGLVWGSIVGFERPVWVPEEKEVWFVNKATGEYLCFEYLGLEFADWAPGFCFLLLGKRLHPPVEEDPD